MNIVPTGFGEWTEDDLKRLHPKSFRMHEAFYFYDMFRAACGQPPLRLRAEPTNNQFLWIMFADCFLTMLVSVEEFVADSTVKRLHNFDMYRFVKQLRNITVHRTVLGGRRHPTGSAPLVTRVFNVHVGSSEARRVEPKIDFDRIRRLLSQIAKSKPKAFRAHVAGSRRFLKDWKKAGNDFVVLRQLFENALQLLGRVSGIPLVEP